MKTNSKWLVGALIGLHFTDLQAADWSPGAEQAFASGSRHFESGDYDRALEQFRIAMEEGMRTVPVIYNIGVCQYRIGDYAGSELSFRRIALEYPDWYHLAQYNIGLALIRQDRIEEAGRAFHEARNSDDTSVIALADAMLLHIAEQGRAAAPVIITSPYHAFIEVGIGYDDNLALLDETNISAGVTTDSAFGEFFGQFGGTIGFADNFRYDASTYLVHYPDASRFDQAVLRLNGTWSWRAADWRVAAGPYYSVSTLDGDGYDQRVGLELVAGLRLTTRSRIALQLAYEEIGELDARYEFIEGNRQLLGLRYSWHEGPHRLALRYEFTVNDRVGPSVSPTRRGLRGGYQHQIDENWIAGLEVTLRSSEYDDLVEPRDEDLGEIALVLLHAFSPKWQLSAEYRYSTNDSNISEFAYDRHRATLGVNRLF